MSKNDKLSRRRLLQTTASTIAAGALSGVPAAQSAKFDGGKYEVAKLRSPEISVGAVQSIVRAVDGKNPEPGKRENLKHMLSLIDKAQYMGRKDLLCFHEFPITGWDKWSRKDAMNLAIEVPGPEVEAIGRKAKENNCYITFGSYVRDKDWPGHLISMTILMGPSGQVVAKHWKQRNIRNAFLGFELFTSSIYDVLDQYVERYGWDAVIAVARTDIGNIACTACQWEPELYRAMAIKGAEIIVRTASGGGSQADLQFGCRTNSLYGVHINNAVSPGNPNFFEDPGGAGGTALIGPRGEILAQPGTEHEALAVAQIPIAAYRARHKLPEINTELYAHVMNNYVSQYPPGVFSNFRPDNLDDTSAYLKTKVRW
jgi:predicted amidohydrolase